MINILTNSKNESTCIVLISDTNYIDYAAFLSFKLRELESDLPKIFVLTIDVEEKLFEETFKNIPATQIHVDMSQIRRMGVVNWNHVSVATYVKILIPLLISETYTKCIYFDIDVFPLRSIRSLIEFPLHSAVAGTQFANGENRDLFGTDDATYFSTGLMLINLAQWRANNFTLKLLQLLNENPLLLRLDADLINLLFREKWQPLPPSFNYMAELALNGYLGDVGIDPMIIHFVGPRKPWTTLGHTEWHQIWRSEYLKFKPGSLQLSRADSKFNKKIRVIKKSKLGELILKLIPRPIKDYYLKYNELKN